MATTIFGANLHPVANTMAACTVSYDHLSWSCFCIAKLNENARLLSRGWIHSFGEVEAPVGLDDTHGLSTAVFSPKIKRVASI